ncbi:MAG: discoidin domain-containing protein [Clostridiales bacterium]|nr:discoidin domain-containing protein [Clostridiales bacterium]
MKNMMIRLLAAAAALVLALCVPAFGLCEETEEITTIVTIVPAPDQTQAERPPCFPDPTENYIPLPETENFAEGKKVISGAHTDVYVNSNVNDGKTDTYWESKGFPAEMVIDLGQTHAVSTVAVCLNPASIWEPRIQEIAVWVSADGESYTEVAAAEKYQFDPATGNRIRIDFDTVDAAFVKVIFTLNSSSRTGGAQAAEICVY